MKVVLAILGGLSLSVVTFVGGLVAATAFFTAGEDKKKLTDAPDLWTNHPVRVDVAKNDFERLPARTLRPQQAAAINAHALPDTDREVSVAVSEEDALGDEVIPGVDETVTGSISPDQAPPVEVAKEPQLSEAHLEWCSSRYRSYRPRDNSYTPYSGGRKQCNSPFSGPSASSDGASGDKVSPPPLQEDSFPEEPTVEDSPEIEQATAESRPSSYGTWEHAQSCFARYRSYRPEDNSYQPYGGGPRRQCE